ncbi:MAG: hypothetical protein FJY20_11765 [Bacteroidetes bacterium]|nr:hypothetical protein [Bacteroidota bacterium]
MNTQHNMEERLWNYIDGLSSADEKKAVEKLLQDNADPIAIVWREKYKELLEVNSLLKSSKLDAPSLRFTKNIMEEIAKLHVAPAAKNYINKKIIWGITFFFIAMITGFLLYGFMQMDFSAAGGSDLSKRISQFDISKFFNNTWVNALMMVNIVFGLSLFDNYLSQKRKKFRKEA